LKYVKWYTGAELNVELPTGELLTSRGPTSYSADQRHPEHYLDYFHGALFVSPGSARVLDDGWVWHPVGIPSAWSTRRWLENAWESEDGPTRVDICPRDYYWNGPFAWLDEERNSFAGPAGLFFSDGEWLFSSDRPRMA
jgi:hypothetical protein